METKPWSPSYNMVKNIGRSLPAVFHFVTNPVPFASPCRTKISRTQSRRRAKWKRSTASISTWLSLTRTTSPPTRRSLTKWTTWSVSRSGCLQLGWKQLEAYSCWANPGASDPGVVCDSTGQILGLQIIFNLDQSLPFPTIEAE